MRRSSSCSRPRRVSNVADLFVGDNLAELQRLTDEIEQVPEVYSAITPYTSMVYSSALVGGPTGTQALAGAVSRDESGAEVRNDDITISLARRGAVGPQSEWNIGNPAWNEVLIFDNTGFTVNDANEPVAPADEDLVIRKSLRGTFPNVEGGTLNGTAVGGIVIEGNATPRRIDHRDRQGPRDPRHG